MENNILKKTCKESYIVRCDAGSEMAHNYFNPNPHRTIYNDDIFGRKKEIEIVVLQILQNDGKSIIAEVIDKEDYEKLESQREETLKEMMQDSVPLIRNEGAERLAKIYEEDLNRYVGMTD